jgi:SAM-dependent methyltransferase
MEDTSVIGARGELRPHVELGNKERMESASTPYYGRDLALVHHRGFGFHADDCAPGILDLLKPVRDREGLVVELGCGSGLLTRHLLDAGHRVIATDASPAMLDLARKMAKDAEDIRQLVLPDDPIPNGVLAIDLCDLAWGEARRDAPNLGRVGDDWAIVTEFTVPSVDRFVRKITTFVRNDDGSWRRQEERHENVLVDTARVPALLENHGVQASLSSSFGTERLPVGLRVVIGRRSVAL